MSSTVTVQQTETYRVRSCRRKSAAGFGITQASLGVLAIIFGVTAAIIRCSLAFIGTGIWCGVYFVVTGCIVYVSATRTSRRWVITSMILSIIAAAVCGLALLSISAVAASEDYIYTECYYFGFNNCYNERDYSRHAIDAVLLVLAVVEAIIAIIYSSLCCHEICCVRRTSRPIYYVERQMSTPSHHVPLTSMGVNQPIYMLPQGVHTVAHPSGVHSGRTQSHQPMIVTAGYPQQVVYTAHRGSAPVQGQFSATRRQSPEPLLEQ